MKKGFTLVELLIVVLIIGILVAIAIPNFRDAQVRARTASSYTNLNTMDIAIRQFVFDRGFMLVEDDEFYYTSWGKERVETDFHGVGANRNPFRNATLYPLTSPISYLSHLMEDPFYTLNTKIQHMESAADSPYYEKNGLRFADFSYRYGDNDPAEKVTGSREVEVFYRWGEGTYERISLNPGEYILWGIGPYSEPYSEGRAEFASFGVVYNPSNGIFSKGIMILHSSEGLLQ